MPEWLAQKSKAGPLYAARIEGYATFVIAGDVTPTQAEGVAG